MRLDKAQLQCRYSPFCIVIVLIIKSEKPKLSLTDQIRTLKGHDYLHFYFIAFLNLNF